MRGGAGQASLSLETHAGNHLLILDYLGSYSGLFGHSCSAKVHMHVALLLLLLCSFFMRVTSDKSPSIQGQTSRAEELGMSRERGPDKTRD